MFASAQPAQVDVEQMAVTFHFNKEADWIWKMPSHEWKWPWEEPHVEHYFTLSTCFLLFGGCQNWMPQYAKTVLLTYRPDQERLGSSDFPVSVDFWYPTAGANYRSYGTNQLTGGDPYFLVKQMRLEK